MEKYPQGKVVWNNYFWKESELKTDHIDLTDSCKQSDTIVDLTSTEDDVEIVIPLGIV